MSEHYQTIQFRLEDSIGYLRFYRPEAGNTINDLMIEECHQVLNQYGETLKLLVLEGSQEVFCFGGDFQDIYQNKGAETRSGGPERLYELWLQLATGPFVSLAHVRGKTNAGGIGFVAACDMVLADQTAVFSLSELLFGLHPACVLPFLIKRIGRQKAHYMTLMTQPVSVEQAKTWGLVDAYEANSADLLRKHMLRLRRLTKPAIIRYKSYMATLDGFLHESKPHAVSSNQEMLADEDNRNKIKRYMATGKFPWESA